MYLLFILIFFFKLWLPEEQFLSMDWCILNSEKLSSTNPIWWCSQGNNMHLHFIGTNRKEFFCLFSFLFMATWLPNTQQCAYISLLKHFLLRISIAFLFQSSSSCIYAYIIKHAFLGVKVYKRILHSAKSAKTSHRENRFFKNNNKTRDCLFTPLNSATNVTYNVII